MSSFRIASALVALTIGAAACTSPGDDSATPVTNLDGDQILLTSALETVDSCDALLERLKDEAFERVGPYGFNNNRYGPGIFFGVEEMEEEAMDDTASFDGADAAVPAAAESVTEGDSQSRAGGGNDFSETNNQEAGVDEADLVKTDGRRLVTVNGNKVRVVDVEGDIPKLINTIKLPDEFYGGELFFNGETALLMTSGWTDRPFIAESRIASDWYPGSPTGRIMELDLDEGEIVRTLEFEGGYLSAREVDGSIRIVMSAAENRFNFVFPSNPGAEDSAERANRDLIEESTIDMWIPTFRITEGSDIVSEGPIVDCDRVYLPTEFAGFGSLVVLTADIDEGLSINDSVSVFTDGQTVYASEDRLAVATPRWPEWDEDGQPVDDDNYRTAIHTFDISDPNKTDFAASGSVRGNLLSQYSMSEYEGNLRVATTDGTPWDSRSSESFVTVFAESGNELSEIGQVGGLGEGEQIFAVRFMGDKGYVVTFEQIDPLYTVDLSDPTNPEVKGELKITGVSQYLHPYGDYLLAVGTAGDENGLTNGAVISVFDVSDPTDPNLVANLPIGPDREDIENGDSGSYSPVANDPRAFNIWDDTMIVPVGWWSYSETGGQFKEENGNGAVLVQVDEDGQLTRIGRIGHPQNRECEGRRVLPVEGDGVTVQRFDGDDVVTTTTEATRDDSDSSDDTDSTDTDSTDTDSDTEDAEASFVRPDEEPPAADSVLPSPDGPEEFCWSYQPEIRRTVVIGDDLYTISDAGIAVNEFDGLDTVTWIPFEG